jgi:hypothetical protein
MVAPDGAATVSPGRLIGVTADRARRYLRHQVIGEDHAQRKRQSVGDLVRPGGAQVRRVGHVRRISVASSLHTSDQAGAVPHLDADMIADHIFRLAQGDLVADACDIHRRAGDRPGVVERVEIVWH